MALLSDRLTSAERGIVGPGVQRLPPFDDVATTGARGGVCDQEALGRRRAAMINGARDHAPTAAAATRGS